MATGDVFLLPEDALEDLRDAFGLRPPPAPASAHEATPLDAPFDLQAAGLAPPRGLSGTEAGGWDLDPFAPDVDTFEAPRGLRSPRIPSPETADAPPPSGRAALGEQQRALLDLHQQQPTRSWTSLADEAGWDARQVNAFLENRCGPQSANAEAGMARELRRRFTQDLDGLRGKKRRVTREGIDAVTHLDEEWPDSREAIASLTGFGPATVNRLATGPRKAPDDVIYGPNGGFRPEVLSRIAEASDESRSDTRADRLDGWPGPGTEFDQHRPADAAASTRRAAGGVPRTDDLRGRSRDPAGRSPASGEERVPAGGRTRSIGGARAARDLDGRAFRHGPTRMAGSPRSGPEGSSGLDDPAFDLDAAASGVWPQAEVMRLHAERPTRSWKSIGDELGLTPVAVRRMILVQEGTQKENVRQGIDEDLRSRHQGLGWVKAGSRVSDEGRSEIARLNEHWPFSLGLIADALKVGYSTVKPIAQPGANLAPASRRYQRDGFSIKGALEADVLAMHHADPARSFASIGREPGIGLPPGTVSRIVQAGRRRQDAAAPSTAADADGYSGT